jgi:hypothetical protein
MEDSLATSFHFTTIDCPETGRPIVVRQNLDPIGQLFVTNQINQHQRDAAAAYQDDLEEPRHRAPSHGPEDVAGWRSRRPGSDSKASQRLQRVAKNLTSDQAKAIQHAMAGHRIDIRTLTAALDALAVVYGLATRTRH